MACPCFGLPPCQNGVPIILTMIFDDIWVPLPCCRGATKKPLGRLGWGDGAADSGWNVSKEHVTPNVCLVGTPAQRPTSWHGQAHRPLPRAGAKSCCTARAQARIRAPGQAHGRMLRRSPSMKAAGAEPVGQLASLKGGSWPQLILLSCFAQQHLTCFPSWAKYCDWEPLL